MKSPKRTRPQSKSLVTSFCWMLSVGPALASGVAHAADHFVPASTESVNCATYNGGVKPGDTITLAAGERGPLTVRNCKGTASQRIIVRNDPAGDRPTVIRRSTAAWGGFLFTIRDNEYLTVDGTGKWRGAPPDAYCGAPNGRTGCGIKVTSVVREDGPSTYLMVNGLSTRLTIRGVEVDGRVSTLGTLNGAGIQQNDHSITPTDYPGFWREEMLYEKNYIHDVLGEGLYIGPNWRQASEGIKLRDITIRENLVEDTGRQNIQLKSAIQGTNRIHHNVVRRSGLKGEVGQGGGISIYEGGHDTKIFNNWVEDGGIEGIQYYNHYIPEELGDFKTETYNNVIINSGVRRGVEMNGHGIAISNASGTARYTPAVYNNTIVGAVFDGINFGSQVLNGVVRDNIIVDWGRSALPSGTATNINNLVGSYSQVRFADPTSLNFRLRSDSPARNGGSAADLLFDDFDGTRRPQEEKSDQGAFEYISEELLMPPVPPQPVVVD